MVRTTFIYFSFSLAWGMDLVAQQPSPPARAPGGGNSITSPLVEDASLNDVCFVDAKCGWAVGEHGCIWHTTDGGKHWQQQKSQVDVHLGGVWFLNHELGWAVGGATQPYLWTSQAIVLRTTDGGQTWEKLLAFVPALEGVKFFDPQHGVAWGRGSGGEPPGVFATDDGGRNWRSLGVAAPAVWWGGDFTSQQNGIVVGPQGQMARMGADSVIPIEIGENVPSARAVKLSDDGTGWMVGEGGLIAHTNDGGIQWTTVDILPEEIADLLKWRTVATLGEKVWIAGSPGSVVLYSPDNGETWQGFATGSNTPLNKITFVDALHGWAVGDLGTILHTHDGGHTWQTQRVAGDRAAVLMILEDESQLPLAALTKIAKCDGYRTIVHLLTAPQGTSRFEQLTSPLRMAEVVHFLGGNSVTYAWQFQSESTENLHEQLVVEMGRLLRTWRPDVLIVPEASQERSKFSNHIADAAEQAVPQAADETQFESLSQQLALSPWQVRRVYALLVPGESGTHRVKSEETVAGTSLCDASISAASLLHHELTLPAKTNEFRLVASHAGQPTAQVDDLVAGLGVLPGSASRRARIAQDDPLAAQAQQRLIEKRRNLRNIFRVSGGNPALLAQVGQMLADLDPTAAASLLYELATHFQAAGQLDLKAATLELLARRYPSDPQVDAGLVWLVQYYASGETAHAYRKHTPVVAQEIAVEVPSEGAPEGSVQQATATSYEERIDFQRFTRAVQITQHIAHTRPLLYAEPQVRVPWAIAERNRRVSTGYENYLESLSLRAPEEFWQRCGSVERWLADPSRPEPHVPLIDCRYTAERPHLDAVLDELLWQQEFTKLSPDDSAASSEFLISRDSEYLYMAIRCTKSPAIEYGVDERPRTYDADLTTHDRIRFLLDMDRDYTTYFDLAIDHRGWTNDACWQDRTWNPQWFVAAGGGEESWTIEAAIPWSALTDSPPEIGDTWAICVERLVPERGSHSLARPLVGEPDPTNFGLLQFK